MMTRILFTLSLLGCATITAFSQGVYWESTISGNADEKTRVDKAYYMPRMVKIVQGDDGEEVIIRLDKEVMTMVDHSKKAYQQITFAEMEQFMKGASGEMDAQMEEMRKQLEQLPEDQRKMAEQMMGSGMMRKEPKVESRNTGETGTISGYKCTKYMVMMDGKESSTVWASRDVKEFGVMRKDMEDFARRMKAMMPAGKGGVTGAMEGIDGFPMQTETAGGWKNVVTKIESRSTPESEFEAPSGYRKDKPMMMGGEGE